MGFQQGDVVWVPTEAVIQQSESQYWPAKFVKQTNRRDICMVCLYEAKDIDEQFLVDTEQIMGFESYRAPQVADQRFQRAYQSALTDHAQRQSIKLEQQTISTAAELCNYVERLMQKRLLPQDSNSLQKVRMAPKLEGPLPLAKADLQLYFQRRTLQMLSYLIESQRADRTADDIEFLADIKPKILSALVQGVRNKKLEFHLR